MDSVGRILLKRLAPNCLRTSSGALLRLDAKRSNTAFASPLLWASLAEGDP